MEVLLYSFSIVLLMFVQGIVLIKVLNLENCPVIVNNPWISILLGGVVSIAFLETLGLVLPISLVTILVVLFSVCAFVWCRKEIFEAFICWKTKSIYSVAIVVVPILLVGLPQILQGEIYTPIYGNSDFAYYFANIDWLREHSILEQVLYSHAMPNLSMAEYMLKTTRIGFDLLSAFFANLFELQPHQAYQMSAILAAIMLAVSVYSLIFRFSGNQLISSLFGVYAAVCGNSITLVMLQYAPQLMGSAFLLLAFVSIHDVLRLGSRQEAVLCGLCVSGVFATYCEYTVYILAFAVLMLGYTLITKKVNLFYIVLAIMVSIVVNVYGFLKAVGFNLSILNSVKDNGISIIDPYSGAMMEVWHVLGNILGMSSKYWAAELAAPYKIATLVGLTATLLVAVAFVLGKEKKKKAFVVISVVVFTALGVYFRRSGGAYQEMKHMTTVAPVAIAVVGLMGACLEGKYKRIGTVLLAAFVLVASFSIYSPTKVYVNECIKVDSEWMELEEGAKLIPDNEEIAIYSEMPTAEYMMAIYALRNQYVNLNSTANGDYLHFFQTFDDDVSRYLLIPMNKCTMQMDSNTEIIWSNDQMALIENKSVPQIFRINITNGLGHYPSVTVCEESDTVMNSDGAEGFLAYGPYVDIDSGTYDITVEYTVMESNGNGGFADIYSQGNMLAYAELETSVGYHELVFEDMSFDQAKAVEFRVYARQGSVIKLEGITYQESSNG